MSGNQTIRGKQDDLRVKIFFFVKKLKPAKKECIKKYSWSL
jgi:hypothetical protein